MLRRWVFDADTICCEAVLGCGVFSLFGEFDDGAKHVFDKVVDVIGRGELGDNLAFAQDDDLMAKRGYFF